MLRSAGSTYLLGLANTWTAQQTLSRATDAVLATFTNSSNSASADWLYKTSGAGTASEVTLANNLSALNVLALQNSHASGFSALAGRGSDGIERWAVGFGNASTGAPFTSSVYLEASYYTGSPHTTAPAPLKFVQTGYWNNGAADAYANYLRMAFNNDSSWAFYKSNGSTVALGQTANGGTYIAANPTSDIYSVFGIRADSTAFVTGASAFSSLIRIEQLGDAAAFVGYNNTALTTSDGFFRIHLDNGGASAPCMTARQDGTGPSYVAEGAGYAWAATSGSPDTFLNRSAAGTVTLTGTTPLLQFGGTTSSFPALKRSTTTMQVKLADDSAFALLESLSLKSQAPAGGTSGTWKLGIAASVSPTSPNRTIEVDIGGTIYYVHAKTTND